MHGGGKHLAHGLGLLADFRDQGGKKEREAGGVAFDLGRRPSRGGVGAGEQGGEDSGLSLDGLCIGGGISNISFKFGKGAGSGSRGISMHAEEAGKTEDTALNEGVEEGLVDGHWRLLG